MKAQKISINQSSAACDTQPPLQQIYPGGQIPSKRHRNIKRSGARLDVGARLPVTSAGFLTELLNPFKWSITWMLPDLTCVHTVHRSDTVLTQIWRQARTRGSWSCAWLYIFRVGEWRMDMWKLFTSWMGFVTSTLSQHIIMWEIPSRCFTPHCSFLWAHQTKNTTHVFIYCTFQNNVTQPPRNEIFNFIWTVPYRKKVISGHFTCRLMSCCPSCTHNCTVLATLLLFFLLFYYLISTLSFKMILQFCRQVLQISALYWWLHVITPVLPCANNKRWKK